MNKVILSGRITKDPEPKYTSNGISYVFFSLAVSRNYSDKDGNKLTDFINCVVWRQQADFLAKYIRKGNLLLVEGRVTTRSYKTPVGDTRYITEILVDQLESLTPLNSYERLDNRGGYQEPTYNNDYNHNYQQNDYMNQNSSNDTSYFGNGSIDIDEDDDLPF